MTSLNPFSDCQFVKDLSGFSGAKTWLVENSAGELFVRKWAQGQRGQRVLNQALWYQQPHPHLLTPRLLGEGSKIDPNSFSTLFWIDLEYLQDSHTLVDCLNTSSMSQTQQEAQTILNKALAPFFAMGQMPPPASLATDYHLVKFQNLLTAFDQSFGQKNPTQNDRAQELTSLFASPAYQALLARMYSESLLADGHGDLTLANILVQGESLYYIDPNFENKTTTLSQELGKVFQSTLFQFENQFNKQGHRLLTAKIFKESGFKYLHYFSQHSLNQTHQAIVQILHHHQVPVDLVFFHSLIHLVRTFPYIQDQHPATLESYFYLVKKGLALLLQGQIPNSIEEILCQAESK